MDLVQKIKNSVVKKTVDSLLTPEKITPLILKMVSDFIGYGEEEKVFRFQRTFEANPKTGENASKAIIVKIFRAVDRKHIEDKTIDGFLSEIYGKIKGIPGIDVLALHEKTVEILLTFLSDAKMYYLAGRKYGEDSPGKYADVEILPVVISMDETEREEHRPGQSFLLSETIPTLISAAKNSGFLTPDLIMRAKETADSLPQDIDTQEVED